MDVLLISSQEHTGLLYTELSLFVNGKDCLKWIGSFLVPGEHLCLHYLALPQLPKKKNISVRVHPQLKLLLFGPE